MPTPEQNCFESDDRDRQLWQLLDAIKGSSALGALTDVQLRASPVPVILPATVYVPTVSANTSSGTISAGCRQITFIASSGFTGTILTNLPLSAGAGLTITAPDGGTIGAIAVTVGAGTLYAVQLR